MTENKKEQTQGFSLKDKSCAVTGLGGLGTNVAVHLAGAGIGKMYLIDSDTVNEANLNRQFMYTSDDTGKYKCDILKRRLTDYAPDCDIIAAKEHITDTSQLSLYEGCDIIFSCVDNNAARFILEEFCRKSNIPLVHGGIDGFYGISYLYIPFLCPSPSEAGLCEGGKANYNISAVAGIVGSCQAALGIKYLITDDSSLGGKILIFDNGITDTLDISKEDNHE